MAAPADLFLGLDIGTSSVESILISLDGSVAAVSGATNSLFYPATTDLSQATPISVQASLNTAGINIALASRPFIELRE